MILNPVKSLVNSSYNYLTVLKTLDMYIQSWLHALWVPVSTHTMGLCTLSWLFIYVQLRYNGPQTCLAWLNMTSLSSTRVHNLYVTELCVCIYIWLCVCLCQSVCQFVSLSVCIVYAGCGWQGGCRQVGFSGGMMHSDAYRCNGWHRVHLLEPGVARLD